MLRKLIISCILLCVCVLTYGQKTNNEIKQLDIGDTIRNIITNNELYSNGQPIILSDLYKQGLLIIDFWATWCVPCIRELKRLDSLQDKYKGKVNILCVTYQSKKEVLLFFKHHPDLKPINLRVITGDTLLNKIFPHRIIPHAVWVDKSGVIIATTGDEDIYSENIHKLISGGQPEFNIKKDNMSFDYTKPLHVDDTGFIYRSILTKYRMDIGNGGTSILWNSDHSLIKRYLGWNLTILDFLWKNYMPDLSTINYKLIELHTSDSSKFLYPKFINGESNITKYRVLQNWKDKNLYCYELSIPKGKTKNKFYSIVNRDICRYFNISTKIELRKIPCWVITGEPNGLELSRTKSNQPYITLRSSGENSAKLIVRDKTINEIFDFFNNKSNFDPYLNRTGIDYPIDMEIQFTNLKSRAIPIELLIKRLTKYGFTFRHEVQPFPVLVIQDM